MGTETPRSLGRQLIALLAAAVFIAIISTACSSGGSSGPAAGTSLPTSPSALPAVSLDQFRGMLAAQRDKPVLLNVWASWCGPCIKEAPALAGLADEYARRVTFVGLDVNDPVANARAFIAKYRWSFPSVADPKGKVRNGLGYVGQPVTVLYDTQGKTRFVQAGDIDVVRIRKALAGVTA
jgi:thiol-disulfide isomerase/thioredoxin